MKDTPQSDDITMLGMIYRGLTSKMESKRTVPIDSPLTHQSPVDRVILADEAGVIGGGAGTVALSADVDAEGMGAVPEKGKERIEI